MYHKIRCSHLFLALALLPILGASQGQAQEEGAEYLRQQNEQLKAKVADLQSALEAARKRITELEDQIAPTLGTKGSKASPAKPKTNPAQTTNSSADPNDATLMKSPEQAESAIRAAYRSDYAASGLPEFGSDKWSEDEAIYERWLRKWIASTDRNFRKSVSWTVVIERSFRANRTESVATLVAWNPEENEQIGDPFQVRIPTRTLERIYRAMRIAGGTVALKLQGVYIPHLQFNRNRIARGPFDTPPFIGPMAELRWSLDVKSLSPVRQEAEKDETTEEG